MCEVLGLSEDKVGIRDDFFRLGGDSIVSIQLVSRIRQRLELQLSIKDIFNYKSIERLYDNVLSRDEKIEIHAEQSNLSGEVRLLPIQEWFFESRFTKANHWNQSFIVKVPELEINKLQRSLDKLVDHHDALRLRYRKEERERYVQYYDKEARIPELKVFDVRALRCKEGSEDQQLKDKLDTLNVTLK